jgi:hypothetical protein
MAGGAIQVEGAKQLRDSLKRAAVSVDDLKAAHKAVAEMIAQRSDSRAPRRSGRLAGDVRAAGTAREAIVRVGRARVPYAGPIHWGWPARNIAPNPWLWETARNLEDRELSMYLDALQKIIDRIEGTHTL